MLMRERFSFEPKRLAFDAACMMRWPGEFFARLQPDGPMLPPSVSILAWSLAAGLIDTLFVLLGIGEGPSSLGVNILTLFFFPPFMLAFTLLLTLPYHGICRLLGGYGSWRTSFRALAALCATLPLDMAAGVLPALWLPLLGFKLYLLARAAIGLHAVAPKKVWAVSGTLFGLLCLGGLLTLLA